MAENTENETPETEVTPEAEAAPEETPVAEETPVPEETAAPEETPVAEETATEDVAAEEAPAEEPAAAPAPEAEAAPAPQSEPKKKKKRLPRALRPVKTRPRRPAATGEQKPIVREPKPEHARGRRQERRGVVVSSAMDKTIVVKVDVIKQHPKYKKVVRRSVKFHAHDEQNTANIGDVVRIVETRPLSKTKHWRLAEIVEVAK
jgi:small subunit ribosomal protein S17